MGAFKFSLQSVLNHRVDIEEGCKNAYQKAKQIYLEECEKVEAIFQKIHELNERTVSGKVTITELQQLNYYREQLKQQLKIQQEVKVKSEKAVEVAQKHLLQATMDVQVMEKLKEKQYDDFLQQELAEENRLLDELACINYGRT